MTIDRTSLPELTISDIAAQGANTTPGLLRRALAQEALNDPVWVAIDARRRANAKKAAEQLPVLSLPVVMACEGLLQSENLTQIPAEKRQLPGWVHMAASLLVGGCYGALLTSNSSLPAWYAGWADFGPAVSWTGTAILGAALGWIYGLAARSFSRPVRAVLDSAVGGYAAIALHPFVGVMAWVGCAAGLVAYRYRRSAAARGDAASTRAQVAVLLSEPVVAERVEAVVSGARTDGNVYTVRWGRFSGTPFEAADILCARALELFGYDLGSDDAWSKVTDVSVSRSLSDTAAAVVGAEIWMLACDATEFEQAASIGPAALGAYASILARSLGEPSPVLPPFPGEGAWPSTVEPLKAKVEQLRAWVEMNIGHESFADIAARAASDLVSAGGGDDRCARAARLLLDSTL